MRSLKGKKNSGFSLIEILVAIGVFSIALYASINFFSQVNQGLKRQSYTQTRIRLFQNLIYIIGMPTTIRASLENDTATGRLWASVRGGFGTVPGMGAVPIAPLPIALFLPVVGGDATTVVTSGMITGTPGAPMLYSLDGGNCIPSAGTVCDPAIYSVSVSTTFMPICPPIYDAWNGVWAGPIYPNGLRIPTSCSHAQYIKVFYRFRPTPGSPPELDFTPVTGSIMVSSVIANTSA
jgi:prepilin-type N-terminal cleavage/methylation domain-containing protein